MTVRKNEEPVFNFRYTMTNVGPVSKQLILGIDGGATKTSWVVCEKLGEILQPIEEGRTGPGSMKLLSEEELRRLLESLPRAVTRVGVFLAGCATEQDRLRLQSLAETVWPGAIIVAGSDRDSGYTAAFGHGDGIAVISGTGSAITGRKGGAEDRAGGWGHLLGDTGGGYDLAIHALRQILFDYDTGHRITALARDVLRTLGLDSLRELSVWAQTAHKSDLARLTPLVFAHADDTEKILREGAGALAHLTLAVADRLNLEAPQVRLMGSVFTKQPLYVSLFSDVFLGKLPHADVDICSSSAALGAAMLAAGTESTAPATKRDFQEARLDDAVTEQVNPRSTHLDRMSVPEMVTLFISEERQVEEALRANTDRLVQAVELTTATLQAGGRLFYAGAGTSGRLGVLDASEMPPTFGVSSDLVQAIIAGGFAAIQNSAEGAEDDAQAGRASVTERGITAADVVCGIAASGRTPFVRGILEAAREIGARTIFISCNPQREPGAISADVAIDLPTGPELLTGSTRLKAGTATKVALNILTTCTMVRLGKVSGNFMSRLRPTNEKLRHRAIRIVADRLGVSEDEAKTRLECANWNMETVMTVTPVSR